MFKAPKKVSDCPYTRKSNGIVRMTPTLISELAAAVHDEDEWAIILRGERLNKGYEINVTGYRLPPQTRSSGHVELPEFDLEADDIGVIHSHHQMGAFFSTTDTGRLNPRFPVSIVVAQKKLQYLGFDYKGTGKVVLPCGASGEIEFFIQPTEGPTLYEVKEVAHNENDLGGCTNFENKATDAYHYYAVAACGLSEKEGLLADAFGQNPALKALVSVLPRPQLTMQQWYDSGSKSLAGEVKCLCRPKTKDEPKGYVCWGCKEPKTSAYNPHERYTPDEQGWFQSLIPNRFKSKKQETEFEVIDADPEVELYLCEQCGKYDPFEYWECENCQDSTYCSQCNRGHATMACTQVFV